jgi:hypothetical protein
VLPAHGVAMVYGGDGHGVDRPTGVGLGVGAGCDVERVPAISTP